MDEEQKSKGLFSIGFTTPKTMRERIYLNLREAIINNKLRPGQRLLEKEIANEFNVSITPVREAMFQLSVEGFVEVETHKSVVVKPVSLEEVSEIYEVQGVLEGYAGRLATLNLNDEHLSEMEKLIEKMQKYLKSNDVNRFYEMNQKAHEIFLKQSGNQLIYDLISKLNLRKKMFRYRVTFLAKKEIMKKAIEDHKKILEGFISRNPDEVEKLVREHWKSDTRITEFESAMQKELANMNV